MTSRWIIDDVDILVHCLCLHENIFLFADSRTCAWCHKILRMWNYLARQCRQIIFVEIDKQNLLKSAFAELWKGGNGISYIKKNGKHAEV